MAGHLRSPLWQHFVLCRPSTTIGSSTKARSSNPLIRSDINFYIHAWIRYIFVRNYDFIYMIMENLTMNWFWYPANGGYSLVFWYLNQWGLFISTLIPSQWEFFLGILISKPIRVILWYFDTQSMGVIHWYSNA